MKVALATQALSESVAAAIDFCRDDLKLADFQGSEATTAFIWCFSIQLFFLNLVAYYV